MTRLRPRRTSLTAVLQSVSIWTMSTSLWARVACPPDLDDERLQAFERALFDVSKEEIEAFAAFRRADKENRPVRLRGFRLVQRADDKQIPPVGLRGFQRVRPADHGFLERDDNNNQELRQDHQVERVVVSEDEPRQEELPPPPLDDLRHLLQVRFPVLYAQVLEPTLADIRQEHSAALGKGHPLKARRILLRGYGALAAAAVCQCSLSLLGRIAALWQARSSK